MKALTVIAIILGIILLTANIPMYAYIKYYGGKADVKVKYLFFTLYPKKKRPPKARGKRKEKKAEKPPENEAPPEENTAAEETQPQEISESESLPETEEKNGTETTEETAEEPPEEKKKKTDKKTAVKKKPLPRKKKQPLSERISASIDELTQKKEAFQTIWELLEGHLVRLAGKLRIDSLILDFAAADEEAAEAALLYGKMNIAVWNTIGIVKSLTPLKVKSVSIDCLYNTPAEMTRYDGEAKIKLRPASLINALTAIIACYFIGLKKYGPALKILTDKKKSPAKAAAQR